MSRTSVQAGQSTTAWNLLFLLTAALCISKLVGRIHESHGDHFAYFQASRFLLAGEDPYLPRNHWVYLYPPFWAFLVAPLALLPPTFFAFAWGAILGTSWWGSRRLILDSLEEEHEGTEDRGRWLWDFLPHLLFFRFVFASWGSGQVTLLLFAVILAGLRDLRHDRPRRAGVWLGLAAAIKVFPAYLGLMFLGPGNRRGAIAMVSATVLLGVTPVFLTGTDRFISLVTGGFLGSAVEAIESQRHWPGRCSPAVALARAIGVTSGTSRQVIELSFFLMITAIVIGLRRRDASHERQTQWIALAVTSMLAVTPMVAENWLSMLIFPCAASLRVALRRPSGDRVRLVLTGGIALSAFLLNIYSPLVVGPDLSNRLQAQGLGPIGLMVFWTTVAVSCWLLWPIGSMLPSGNARMERPSGAAVSTPPQDGASAGVVGPSPGSTQDGPVNLARGALPGIAGVSISCRPTCCWIWHAGLRSCDSACSPCDFCPLQGRRPPGRVMFSPESMATMRSACSRGPGPPRQSARKVLKAFTASGG